MSAGSNDAHAKAVEKLRTAQALIAESLTLLGEASKPIRRTKNPKSAAPAAPRSIRFDLNERAFVKNIARGLNGGPRKFVALVAYLAKGKSDVSVSATDVQRMWNRNKAKDMLGMAYNRAYASRAKSEGWVNPAKYGHFVLDASWRNALSRE
jgi:hypothetical protein